MSSVKCENCGYMIEECKYTCPYCGETHQCSCCVGYGAATGG